MNHPILPAGFNADPIDGDEVDGAGTNWAVWPVLFDSFIGLHPLVVNEEMMDAFDQACPDVVIAHFNDMIVIPPEQQVLVIRHTDQVLEIAGQNDTAVVSSERDTQVIRRRA